MSARLLVPLALALLALAAACGGDGSKDDPRILEVGFVAEEAVYAYAGAGPAGLYPYLAPEVRDRCAKDAFSDALAGRETPTGFRGLKGVDFEGDEARATVSLIVRDHDEEVEWVFVPNPEGPDAEGYRWYLKDLPGLEDCR